MRLHVFVLYMQRFDTIIEYMFYIEGFSLNVYIRLYSCCIMRRVSKTLNQWSCDFT